MTRGGAREVNGSFYANARYGRAKRLELKVPAARSLEDARARAEVIAEVAEGLTRAGRRDLVRPTAKELALASTEKQLAVVRKVAEQIISGAKRAGYTDEITLRDWAARWTKGELAKEYPDHVAVKDHGDDISRLKNDILPLVGDVPVRAFSLHHAELVMSKLPSDRSPATRRHVAQVMGRLMHLAVFPGKLLAVSPLPRGWLPKLRDRRHYSCLFPREEALLLGSSETSEAFRLFCGVLDREGMRLSELLDCDWWQWGDDCRTFTATKTKTGDPRMWAVRPDVAEAMRIWKERSGGAAQPFAYVAALGDRTKLAERFRAALRAAGVTRPELFESTEHTAKLRAHDMRATFVTISLAEGKSETWIRDRTAHKSTSMIDRYRRTARQVAELGLGSLVDLVDGLGWRKGGGKAPKSGPREEGVSDEKCTGRDLNPHAFWAAEPKSARTSRGEAGSEENPVDTRASKRRETASHHPSTTPVATPRDSDSGISIPCREGSRSAPDDELSRASGGACGVRLEVDGGVVARVDVRPGDDLEDVAGELARRAARGSR